MQKLPRTVWIVSLVSLFTDLASEILYPVIPIYLKSIGFSIALIGLLEGFAEAITGLSKGYFGKLSDKTQKRVIFIRAGYSLSAISKPLMALLPYPAWVFIARTSDRLGKGIRTGARDAFLSDAATPETKGRIFGFHRGMDTFGAFLGPLAALIYLYYNPGNYKALFIIALAPGLIALALTFLLKEPESKQQPKKRGSIFEFVHYVKESPAKYKRIIAGLLAFALFNSSDFFLLLVMKNGGMSDTGVIGIYMFYNLIYASVSYPIGIHADKIGLKTMFTIGIGLFAVVYIGMGIFSGTTAYLILFAIYGVYAACTEGMAKAWISNVAERKDTATAIGAYSAFNSLTILLSSTLAGLIWSYFGAPALFIVSGIGAALCGVYFVVGTEE